MSNSASPHVGSVVVAEVAFGSVAVGDRLVLESVEDRFGSLVPAYAQGRYLQFRHSGGWLVSVPAANSPFWA